MKANVLEIDPVLRAKVGDSFADRPYAPKGMSEWAHTVINDDGTTAVGRFVKTGEGPGAYWTRVR